MKPNPYYLLRFLPVFVLFACSPDNSNNNSEEENNEFIFNGVSYSLVSAIVTDENTSTNDPSEIGISLFNKTSSEITGNGDLNDVSYVYFDFLDTTIQNTTYNLIGDYNISVNGTIADSIFNPGIILLEDSDSDADVYAQSGSVTITNFTAFNIAFTFTFIRNDGQIITGSYDGNYFAPNGMD
jgi:hypothetical protein